jgi:processive 1,2-diacylglycerol beta-glucosyltransferase
MRLLIISTGAGTGHVQAAAALEEAARRTRPGVEVRNIDALDYGTSLLRDLYERSYVLMANRIPALWGLLYERSETSKLSRNTARALGFVDRRNARQLVALVERTMPDRIVCTHFLPASALSRCAKVPVDLVVTDFDVHSFWIQPGVRRFFVATDDLRDMIVRKGVEAERVSVHGIPISDRFLSPPSREEARKELDLPGASPVLLAMGGGFGRRGLLDVVGNALEAETGPVVLAVAGRSEKMHESLQRRFGSHPRIRIFRFVRRIEALMSAADLIVTKPGGLTSCESLAVGRPMILTAPVPGQEERNAEYLVRAGAAVTAFSPEELRSSVESMLGSPDRLAEMIAAARKAGRPRAAERIVGEVLDGLDDPADGRREFVATPEDDC